MPTNAKTKSKNSAERKARNAPPKGAENRKNEGLNAIELLQQDHREVEAYFEEFEEFEDLEDEGAKGELAEKICMALTVHTQIEEEIFYPVSGGAEGDEG